LYHPNKIDSFKTFVLAGNTSRTDKSSHFDSDKKRVLREESELLAKGFYELKIQMVLPNERKSKQQ
jgi:hypothetical protein